MSEYVRLESDDGFSFVVARKTAMASGTLRAMLDQDAAFEEAKSNVCKLQLRAVILLKVIEYLAYKTQYAEVNASEITEDFSDRISPWIALELLEAADFLDT